MTMLSTTSRMNKICFIVDYALTKFPPSKYYPIALFGPIMVRFCSICAFICRKEGLSY